MSSARQWFAVYTNPRAEKKAALALAQQGIEHYLPLQVTLKQWSDRKKKVEEPLFKSYLFVHIDLSKDYYAVLNTRGIVKFIKIGQEHVPVRPEVIAAIRLSLMHFNDIRIEDAASFTAQQPVEVTAGPLKGFKGVVVHQEGNHYFAILIEQLGAGALLKIPSAYLKAI